MTDTDEKDLPDVVQSFDGLEDLQRVTKGQPQPKIRWGENYKKWPITKRLQYAEAVASAMNHSAKMLIEERDFLNNICRKQERLIEQAQKDYAALGQVLNTKMTEANAKNQSFIRELQEAKARIRELERGDHD